MSEFKAKLEERLLPEESILWLGEPKPKFTISLWNSISTGSSNAEMSTGGVSPQGNAIGLLLLVLVVGLFYFGYWVYGTITLFILLLPDFVKHYRKRFTKYAITNKRVIFQLWWWGKKHFNTIQLNQVNKIQYEDFGKDTGPITFFIYDEQDFWTRDFMHSEESVYPTFELIENVEQQYLQIVEIVKENK